MPTMPDPHAALLSYESALRGRAIAPERCVQYPELTLCVDKPGGQTRLSYALTVNGRVQVLVICIVVQPYQGIPCFQVGYAVAEPYRNKGLASETLKKVIAEMRHGFRAHMDKFYLEAVVEKANAASRKVAERGLSSTPKEIIDEESALPALQYFRLVECNEDLD